MTRSSIGREMSFGANSICRSTTPSLMGVAVFVLLLSAGEAIGLEPSGGLLVPHFMMVAISPKGNGRGNVFVVNRGDGDKIVKEFNVGTKDNLGDKLKLVGFGLTNFAEIRPLLRQYDDNVLIELPGNQRLWILKHKGEDFGDNDFQLELDRKNLTKTFADEFDTFSWYAEGTLDGRRGGGTWRTNLPHGPPTSLQSRIIDGSQELQIYVEPSFRGRGNKPLGIDPFSIRNGILEIAADRAPEEIKPLLWDREYTSGVITTMGTFSQLYGVFEMRARLPKGRGLWPAFWLVPANAAWPPELDIMEVLGHDTTTLYTTWHSAETGTHTTETFVTRVPDLSTDFHTYAIDWEKDEIKWYFDGVEVAHKATPADMHVAMQIRANLAVGGWSGNPDASTRFPAVFTIDWIRAYQRRQNNS